jgi:hypothetical protein
MNRAQNIYEFRRIHMHGTKSGPNADPDYAEKYHPGKGDGRKIQKDDRGTKEGHGELKSPPVREDGTVRLHHWSRRNDLTELDPQYHGTGITGMEWVNKERYPDLWEDRTYFGIAPGEPGGYVKEYSLGPYEYTVDIPFDQLYDISADPDGFKSLADWRLIERGYLFSDTQAWVSALEQVVAESDYAGYWLKTDNMGLTAVVFENTLPVNLPEWWELPPEQRPPEYRL